LLSTPAGDLELAKLREGSFFPSLLERRSRIDRALFAVVMEVVFRLSAPQLPGGRAETDRTDDLMGAPNCRSVGADGRPVEHRVSASALLGRDKFGTVRRSALLTERRLQCRT
jgi:Transposase, Mutator family